MSESMNVRLLVAKLPAVGGFTAATHGARGGGVRELGCVHVSICVCVCACAGFI